MHLIFSLFAAVMLLLGPVTASAAAGKTESIVLAGGCFWGVEAVFEQLKGVRDATSGYAGGAKDTATYKQVSGGTTGHAEAVKVTYDPNVISLAQLVEVYFSVAHNPTELNYQGPDYGTQYRSAVFYANHAQQKAAQAAIAKLTADKAYDQAIVTKLEPLTEFYPAEEAHQDFARLNPYHPYILMHDAPKVAALKKKFPALCLEPKS